MLSAVGCVIITCCVLIQLLASVIVTVYVPAAKPVAVAAVPPLGDQLYVLVPVPPLAVMVAEPFVPPLQLTLVCDDTLDVSAAGSVMVTCCVLVQLLASVI